jgi:hypothetical protein
MDRIHFIEQQVERLDDQAFAAFLAWFDRHADLRWAGRWTDDSFGVARAPVACITDVADSNGAAGAGHSGPSFAYSVAHRSAHHSAQCSEPLAGYLRAPAQPAASRRVSEPMSGPGSEPVCQPRAAGWLAQMLRGE